MRILVVRPGGSTANKLIEKAGFGDVVRICSPGAMLAGSQFDLIVIDSEVRQDEKFQDWLSTSVRCRLHYEGIILW